MVGTKFQYLGSVTGGGKPRRSRVDGVVPVIPLVLRAPWPCEVLKEWHAYENVLRLSSMTNVLVPYRGKNPIELKWNSVEVLLPRH
jgi:hypothetical protein